MSVLVGEELGVDSGDWDGVEKGELFSCRLSNNATAGEEGGCDDDPSGTREGVLRGEEDGVNRGERDSLYLLILILVSTLLVGRGGLRGGVEKSRGVARVDSVLGVK